MAATQVNPTRMELTRLKKKLVGKGEYGSQTESGGRDPLC